MRYPAKLRWLAGGSFSLYLVHYPVLQVLAALGLAIETLAGDALLPGLTLAICYGFAAVFERRLPTIRQALKRLWPVPNGKGNETDAGLVGCVMSSARKA